MRKYDHLKLEKKWQKVWESKGTFKAQNSSKKPKYYSLIEFPYPSGDGLHVGHPRPYIGMDVISRKRRLEGYNVLYPIGWDAFGLPTENFAIKTGKDPRVVTKKNSDNFRRQIKSLGVSFDWSREVNTTDPKYYKWTQWIFLQFLKKGLAYKAKIPINWCPKDKIGLANEEVVGGNCERCGTPVEKREKEQWMLAITKYADRLHKDLDAVDYLPQIKLAQRNWIGRSEGAEIDFSVREGFSQVLGKNPQTILKSFPDYKIRVFTTRPDTIFGATFLAIAPELAKKLTGQDFGIKYDDGKEDKPARNATHSVAGGEKEGKDTGIRAMNPATKEEIPVWVVNYVSAEYGTGAIMGVPAHDERDFEFAKKYNLPVKQVIKPMYVDGINPPRPGERDTKRDIVIVAVKHWKENKYLLNASDKFKWKVLFTGGIEEGENPIECAKREIQGETGYKNFRAGKILNFTHIDKFYAQHKGVNREVNATNILLELENGEKEEISEEEKELHQISWKTPEEMMREITHDNHRFIFEFALKGGLANDWPGILMNSGKFSGMDSEKAKKEIIKFVGGEEKITFKLRDWVFSRQRYWGEPIPVVHCEKCGIVPVPEKDLPVELPKVKNYQPTDSGESPLANISKWVNTKCPKCKGPAKRETDTMPNWAGSSWYYLRYADPKNKRTFADKKALKYWTPVDWYNGGNEHTTLHLLYSRFWHKFLYDLKLVPTSEPYKKRTSHGMILGEGGVKMSKSLGNVINPDEIVRVYGADTLRVYEMFMGPFDQSVAWSTESIIGARRFVEKVWRIGGKFSIKKNSSGLTLPRIPGGSYAVQNFPLSKILNKTIKKVSEDIENMNFNTAISSLMILAGEMDKAANVAKEDFKKFLQILSPFAPHIAEELWAQLGEKKSISFSSWPKWDPALTADDQVKIAVQVNGKVRAEITVSADISEAEAGELALGEEAVKRHMRGQPAKKIIYVKNRLVNIVL